MNHQNNQLHSLTGTAEFTGLTIAFPACLTRSVNKIAGLSTGKEAQPGNQITKVSRHKSLKKT